MKTKILDLNSLLELSRTQTTIVATQKDISDGRVNLLRTKNLKEREVSNEVRETSDTYYRLLQNNYVELRKDYDELLRKFSDLEIENSRLLNSKQLMSSENTRVNPSKLIYFSGFGKALSSATRVQG